MTTGWRADPSSRTAPAPCAPALQDRDPQRLSVDLSPRGAALFPRELEQRLIGNCFHESVPQEIEREPGGADGLRIRDPLLDLRVGECGVRANGAIVDERAPRNHDRATRNRDIRVAEVSGGVDVADAQLADLA